RRAPRQRRPSRHRPRASPKRQLRRFRPRSNSSLSPREPLTSSGRRGLRQGERVGWGVGRRVTLSPTMRAVLLGTGSPPPNPKRRGPATLLSLGDEKCLVDAGSGVGNQLVQAGVRPYDWPRVLITHHHSDHVIDLAHLLITRWIVGQNAPFEVWGPAGTKRQMEKLLD